MNIQLVIFRQVREIPSLAKLEDLPKETVGKSLIIV